MSSNLTPAAHILVRFRELLEVALFFDGVSSQAISVTSYLAFALWHNCTLDVLLAAAHEVLSSQDYITLVRFCQVRYPIVAVSLHLSDTSSLENALQ